jgi:endonuclease/exonuclease/phosphatase family metal-dependent hydrolase
MVVNHLTVKVMTLNIWNYNEPWHIRLNLIADLIGLHKPDVIGLQEIRYDERYDPEKNQAEQIAERLTDYRFTFEKAQIDSADRWEGLAILSKFDIIDSSYIRLSRDMEDELDKRHQRIVLRAVIDLPVGQFNFFNTHLSLSDKARKRVIIEVVDFLENFESNLPKVIVGDFNATLDQEPIKFITGMILLKGRKTLFQDSWAKIHGTEGGFTCCAGDFRKRIDYIFVTPERGKVGKIIDCKLIANKSNEDRVCPSDHYGLITTLQLS